MTHLKLVERILKNDIKLIINNVTDFIAKLKKILTLIASVPVNLFCFSWSFTMMNGRPYSSNARDPDILNT